MELRIRHETRYQYSTQQTHGLQLIRLTPHPDNHQTVNAWQVSLPASAKCYHDAYGNLTHLMDTEQAYDELVIGVSGTVTTHPLALVDACVQPPGALDAIFFLRQSPLADADTAIRQFVLPWQQTKFLSPQQQMVSLQELTTAIHNYLPFTVGVSHANQTASEVFAMRMGVCQDHAHVFIACCRDIGIPARYVSGYLYSPEHSGEQVASHAWAEAFVTGFGWVGFDIANNRRTDETHVRLAHGLDYFDACPVRGVRIGAGSEQLSVRVLVECQQ